MSTDTGRLIVAALANDVGRALLADMRRRFVDRPIYTAGQTLDGVAYQQGRADVVRWLETEMARALAPQQENTDAT